MRNMSCGCCEDLLTDILEEDVELDYFLLNWIRNNQLYQVLRTISYPMTIR